MPRQRTASRSALSLERKLPILIGGLVTGALLVMLLLVRWELRSSAIDAAGERLRIVGEQLGSSLDTLIAQRTALYESVAGAPELTEYLLNGEADSASVHRLLESLRGPSDRDLPVQLRTLGGSVVAAVGTMDDVRASAAGELPLSAADRQPDSAADQQPVPAEPPRSDRIVYSVFTASADRPTYWVSVPVWRAGNVVGHITQRRGVGAGAALVSRLEGLIGGNMELYVAHVGGGDWAGLDASILSGVPRVPLGDDPFTYARGDGSLYFAHTRRLESTPWLLVTHMPMAGVTARMDRVINRLALIGLFLLAMGLFAAWLVSRSVTRPLRQLGAVADAIAAGDYSRRAHFDRADEIGRLARSFDAMAARVDGTYAELQRRFREAQALAGELELANARLHAAIRDAESARTDAQQASSAKSEFLATMSHEIRTPINAIIGYTDLLDLRIGGALTEQQQNYVERIRMSSDHLTSVVNDVLDFAKIESGQMRIARDVRSAAVSIDGAISMLQGRASEKNIRLSAAGPVEAVYLGDPQRVQQILLNLLSNALKFTPEGGTVSVECEHRESRGFGEEGSDSRTSWTCIAVRDTGIGITPDLIVPIFEPFVQGAGGYTRPHGGTGLGLAISRSLARMMEGDLTVESEPGKGSTFTLWLPHPSKVGIAVG